MLPLLIYIGYICLGVPPDTSFYIPEQYFLGKDANVDSMLNIKRYSGNSSYDKSTKINTDISSTTQNDLDVKDDELKIEHGKALRDIEITTWGDITNKFYIDVSEFDKMKIKLPDEIATVFIYNKTKIYSLS